MSTDNAVRDDFFRIESGIEHFLFCLLTLRAWIFSFTMKNRKKIFTSTSHVSQSTYESRVLADRLSLDYRFTLRDCGRTLLDLFPARDRFYIYFQRASSVHKVRIIRLCLLNTIMEYTPRDPICTGSDLSI